MKRRNKLLSLCLALLTIFSGIPFPTNIVYASGKVPELTAYQKGLYPRLEWAVEIDNNDVIIETSFEDGEMRPTFRVRDAVQYEEGVPYSEVMNTGNRELTKYAHGWVNKSYFNGNNGLNSISREFNQKYTIYKN